MKTCLTCGELCSNDVTTCPKCGEGSWAPSLIVYKTESAPVQADVTQPKKAKR